MLLRLAEPQLPRIARVLDARQRGRSGAAGVARDHHVIRIGLGHARSHRAHAAARDQLHAYRRARVHTLQVVDELREIFNRVDVMVRRRRDQTHSRLCVPQPRNQPGDLMARQLSALTGLGALRHLDLDLFGVSKILRRHAKTA